MAKNLYGTLVVEGDREYEVTLVQANSKTTWVLSNEGFYNKENPSPSKDIVAVLSVKVTGTAEGYGKYFVVSRMLDTLNRIVQRAVVNNAYNVGFFVTGEYDNGTTGDLLHFKMWRGGRRYEELQMVSEGFRLNLSTYPRPLPCILPDCDPIATDKAKAAIASNLGIKSAEMLRKAMGSRLDFLDKKHYVLVDSNEKFREMFLEFLRAVQSVADRNMALLVGLDTETSGLKMINLSPDNPVRDHVVAIPFSWKDDEGYLICTDMVYFGNVDGEEVYPLFQKIFSRNPDYTVQDIELDYCGEHFKFSRKNIDITGANVMFDTQGFLVHDSDIYFDDDLQIILYNLATDWVQGRNSLKEETRLLIGDETLELEELYGARNKDKFAYLQDPLLALWYGAADADYSRLVTKKALAMSPSNLISLYRRYDMTLVHELAHAAFIGLPVDSESVKKQGALVKQDMDTLSSFIYRYAYMANKENLESKQAELRELLYTRSQQAEYAQTRKQRDSALEDEQMLAALLNVDDEEREFRFKLTPANKKHLVYDMLHYPVLLRSEIGEPKLDKEVRKKLLAINRETPANILLEDIKSAVDPKENLISKEEFNKKKYPLMLAFDKLAVLEKEYNSYYRPLMENDLEGKMFYGFNMARAATRRILSPGQTMKGSLKELVVAPPGKIFMCFDVSQMEYRLMASVAYIATKATLKEKFPDDWEAHLADTGIAKIVKLMGSEEADYHIETAAMMTNVPPHRITKDVRKSFKKVGFGIPYGLSVMSLCEDLYGDKTPQHLKETQELYDLYASKQVEIMAYLEHNRDMIFKPAEISQEQREWMSLGETFVGKVYNLAGFYRLFILDNLTRSTTASYRRKGGNFGIQGGAAEIFRRMLYNSKVSLVQAGMDKQVDLHMVVHDEGDYTCDEHIDALRLISIFYKSCVLRYKDHIPYYIGIGFGHNWHDAKDDGAELPIRMVRLMVDAWEHGKFDIPKDGRQPENLLELKRHYMCDRIEEELQTIIHGLGPGHVWTEEEVSLVDDQFTNYIVRAYLNIFASDKMSLKERLVKWQAAREEYGFGVKFLTRKFRDYSVSIEEMDLESLSLASDSLDLSVSDLYLDALENSSDEAERNERQGNIETTGSLFDYEELQEDINSGSGEGYYNGEKQEDLYEYNPAATNPYDIFTPKYYVRQKVLKSKDDVFSVALRGTAWDSSGPQLQKLIRKRFMAGSATILLVGKTIIRVTNIDPREEDLNWLDQSIIAGKEV